MIRGFAIALAVGTIRIWVGLFALSGLVSFRHSSGQAFWIAFILHALAAEVYLARGDAPQAVHRRPRRQLGRDREMTTIEPDGATARPSLDAGT